MLNRALFVAGLVCAGLTTISCGAMPTGPTAVAPSSLSASAGAAAPAGGADLQVAGAASTGSPAPGAAFTYTFQVKNSGPTAAAAVTLVDALPAGTGYVSAAGNGPAMSCGVANAVVSCGLGDLASGGQATVVVTLTAPVTVGAFANTGTVSSPVADANTANNSVTVTVQVKAPAVDTIKVTKCYTNATATGGGEMLIKASSSDPTARLFAYRPDGTLIGELQNGGGSRYGGTVMPWQAYDPATVTIRSSSGGSITVPTTPFQV